MHFSSVVIGLQVTDQQGRRPTRTPARRVVCRRREMSWCRRDVAVFTGAPAAVAWFANQRRNDLSITAAGWMF
jgi:hypothetical protein